MLEGWSWIEIAAMALFLVVWTVGMVRQLTLRPEPVEYEDFAGSVGEIEVGTVRIASGRELVGIVVRMGKRNIRVTGCLQPSQARRLAQMLRIAAAPGRNVVQARWNVRRGRAAQPKPD